MVRIIINGATGAMGRAIAQCAAARSDEFTVVAGIAKHGDPEYHPGFPIYLDPGQCAEPADIVIDFSLPDALEGAIALAKAKNAGLVIGTTGIGPEGKARIEAAAEEIPVFMASNMSLGVNLQIDLVKRAASFLGDPFEVEIIEKHHNKKLDAPSGTALSLANAISEQYPDGKEYVYDRHSVRRRRDRRELGIHSVRGGTIVGEHQVMFIGDDEILEIYHSARSKKVFAQGALRAAQFIFGRDPKVYSMGEIFADLNALTDVSVTPNQSVITVSGMDCDPAAIASLFSAIADVDINIDMISQTTPKDGKVDISFTLPDAMQQAALTAISGFPVSAQAQSGLAKMSVEGFGMEHRPGIAAQMFSVLAKAGVPVRLVTTSETKISYCIDSKDIDAAYLATKDTFGI